MVFYYIYAAMEHVEWAIMVLYGLGWSWSSEWFVVYDFIEAEHNIKIDLFD